MTAVFSVIDVILNIYWWIIIVSVILSWLYAFNVVNPANQFVRMVGDFVYQATEPLLGRIRRFMPNLGTIDISPIVLFLAIFFLQKFLRTTVAPAFGVFSY